ncbi:ABC transporter permease [bacterium]|nr:ABC transporter permease [bacterium]
MLKNYLLVAFRNLLRNWSYSLINIAGFALGLAVTLLIALVVIDDLSYDRFHHYPDDTYRFLTQNRATKHVNSITSGALTKETAISVPGVIATTRVFGFGTLTLDAFGAAENEAGIQRRVLGTDSSFFKVFPAFKVLEGDPDNQLTAPSTAVVTREVASALFGDEPAVGQVVEGPDGNNPFTITGVVADCPPNSHIQYDIIVPAIVNEQNRIWWESWDNISGHGYLRAEAGIDQRNLELQIEEVGVLNGLNEQYQPRLQPIRDVHLGSSDFHFDVLNFGRSDKSQVIMLSAIALLTLLIASINFINLSSARAVKRAREVGMRKVVGANPRQIMGQYLGESVLLTLISMVFAAVLVELTLPLLTNFIGKEPTYTLTNTPILLVYVLGVTLLVGLLSGVYPALVLTRFKPVAILKGRFQATRQGVLLRQVLVVFQYSISIALIASVIILLQQLRFVSSMDVGYEKEQTIVTFTFNQQLAEKRQAYLDALRTLPTVEAACSSIDMFGFGPWGRMEGRGEDSETGLNEISFYRHRVGAEFIPAMGIDLLAGRNFTRTAADSGQSVIINEAALRALDWADGDPIGKRIIIKYESGLEESRTVVGVVGDFAVANAREQVDAVCMEYSPAGGGFVAIRLQEGAVESAMEQIETIWSEFYQDIAPFNYVFLNDQFDRQYRNDRNFMQKTAVFSALAIIIASLGLLGLSSYNAEQRRREIAIRKVLGSGEGRILLLLTRDAVKWVLIANVFGWIGAWFVMNRWLEEFAYRVSVGPSPFLLAGAAALLLAISIVSLQAWRAALTNPTTLLHQE